MTNLSKSCVLVNLTIRSWIANKQDTVVAQEVATAKGVEDVRMGRYWKSLLPKCAEVDLVNQTMGKARSYHYANTLPYMHEGPRILPTEHFESYQLSMRAIRTEFDLAVLAMVARYDDLKRDAKQLMGSLYNELDYPEDKSYVQSRYSIETTVLPLPSSDTLLQLGFDQKDALEMKLRLETELSSRFRKNARALWDQLDKNVEGLVKTLKDPKKAIRNDSLDVSRRMAQLLPRLNVVEDRRLDAVCQRLDDILVGVTHAVLSTDIGRRDTVSAALRVLRVSINASTAPSSLLAGYIAEATVAPVGNEFARAAA